MDWMVEHWLWVIGAVLVVGVPFGLWVNALAGKVWGDYGDALKGWDK
jgi:hypothetical protein